MCVNFVHATNSANHYATPPTVSTVLPTRRLRAHQKTIIILFLGVRGQTRIKKVSVGKEKKWSNTALQLRRHVHGAETEKALSPIQWRVGELEIFVTRYGHAQFCPSISILLICSGCLNTVTSAGRISVDIGASTKLELVDKFCYLGDMLSVNGDADAVVEARIWIGWNKFRQLVPLLTNKDASLIMRGRLYSSCVRSSMLHGSETWPVRKQNVVALQWAEMRMVRWM